MTRAEQVGEEIQAYLRARTPLLWIVTREEGRAEGILFRAAQAAGYVPRTWDCADGVCDLAGRPMPEVGSTDPVDTLNAIRERALAGSGGEPGVWILRDLPGWLGDAGTLRKVRTMARLLPTVPLASRQALVIITPVPEVPPTLAGHATVIEWPLPDRTEVAALLDAAINRLPETDREGKPVREAVRADLSNGKRDAAIDAAVGLSGEEIASTYSTSLVKTRKIDPAAVSAEKKRVISRERVIEWVEPIPGGLLNVGGLGRLKQWIEGKIPAFSEKARAFGLPAPRGVLIVGVPGCGKSLTAKVVPTALGVPLLRLDLGAVKSKFVGESEGNLRRALKTAETCAPCVLWLDEIEKALSGATQGAADGGVSADALGTLLSWQQERAASVFLIATANNVDALPPELLRAGRFDAVFSVDLPTATERTEILAAALRAHKRDPKALGEDLARIAGGPCEGFSGSEIASLVPEALARAFARDQGRTDLTPADLLAAASEIVPLSKTAPEKIAKIRDWTRSGRARPASFPEKVETKSAGQIDV